MTMLALGIAAVVTTAGGALLGAAAYLCLAEPSSEAEWDWQQER